MITTYHNISFGTQTVPEQIPVVQGDTGREIVFILTDFTIPEGATATYYVQKPSGEAVYNTATISENNIIVPLTAQSIIEVGENDMQVRVILGEDIVTSFRAILMVRPFLGIGAVESSTEINIFDQAVEAAKEEITAAVGEAEGEIETATEEAIAQVHDSALAFFVTDTASGAIATFPDGADNVPVKALTVEIEPVQSGSGDPSPTNVRPITGWSEAKVTRTGENKLALADKQMDSAGLTGSVQDKIFTLHGTLNGNYDRYVDSDFIPEGVYVVSGFQPLPTGCAWYIYDTVGGTRLLSDNDPNGTEVTISGSNKYRLGLLISQQGLNVNIKCTPSLSAVADVYTIDLSGTRYGGTLDVGTGVLTVTHGIVDLGTLNYTLYNSTSARDVFAWNNASAENVDIKSMASADTVLPAICEEFYATSYNATWHVGEMTYTNTSNKVGFIVAHGAYADGTAFKTAMSGIKFVYELASPVSVQLDPETVTTLLGQNCILADCGDVTVAYRADTKLYLDKILNA